MGFEIELRDSGTTATVASGDINTLSLPRRHSVINQWQANVPEDTGLEDWTYADAFVFYENKVQGIPRQLVYRGEFERPETPDGAESTTLHGKDVTRKLDREGAEETYTSIPYYKAVEDYTTTHLSNWTWNVVAPTPAVIDSNLTVQDTTSGAAMADLFTPTADQPFEVDANGNLNLLQTCYLSEAEDADRETDPFFVTSDGSYSGGGGQGVYSSSSNNEWDFTPQYTIPSGDVGVWLRMGDTSDAPACEWILEVNGVEHQLDSLSGGEGTVFSWRDFASGSAYNGPGYSGPDLTGGETVTVKFRATGSSGGSLAADVVAGVVDNRFSYTFDNSNDGSGGYLDGPELYPDVASIVSNPYSSTFNIQSSSLTTTIDDTSGGQALQLSNDGGTNFYPQDGSQNNTQTVSADFAAQSSYGTTIRSEVSLSRYGSRTTATPQTGFKGQTLSAFTLDITTNDLAVIDGPRVFGPGTHYENLQTLHQDGGMRFVPQFKENSLEAETFRKGDVTKTLDVVTKDHTRTTPDKDYANVVVMVGAEDGSGNRLTATAKDQDAINADGGEKKAYVPRTSIDNKGDLKSLARTELSRRLENDSLTGSLEIWPQLVAPGYSYVVDELDGETLALEQVEFQYGVRGERGGLDFAGLSDLATQLSSIQAGVTR